MTIVVNQYFGVGDCIFSMTLVKRIANGNKIIWPVLPHFVDGLQRAYPSITWIDVNGCGFDLNRMEQYEVVHPVYGECVVLPIRFAGDILKLPYREVMAARYKLYGIDWQEWRMKAMWQRDSKKEKALRKIVGKGDIVVNRFFRSDSSGCAQIDAKGIEMSSIYGFSIFDWCGIWEEAKEIHTVSTSIIYLLELLPITAEIHLYLRRPDEADFKNIDYILQRHKYIKHA